MSGWATTTFRVRPTEPPRSRTHVAVLLAGGTRDAGVWASAEGRTPTGASRKIPRVSTEPESRVWNATESGSNVMTTSETDAILAIILTDRIEQDLDHITSRKVRDKTASGP